MTIEVRPTAPDEFRRAAGAMAIALMNAPPNDEQWQRSRPSWEEMPSLSAWDGDRCVGHAGQFLVDTTLPGGARVSTGAVSRVGVMATHRRRGIATRLMEGLIVDAAERGLTLMSLRASETTIYGRYGFGLAGDCCDADVFPARARPIAGAAGGPFRILEPDEIVDTVAPLYDRVAHRRIGVITRPASFWQRMYRSAIERTSGSFVVVHRSADGYDDGYVHYDVKWDEQAPDGPTGNGEVHDLWGATDAVELALWRYVTEVDLVTRWRLHGRPIDDLVRSACHDLRAHRVRSVDDEQWLRLVDIGTALAARSYRPVAGTVTIEVTDPLVDANNGSWEVSPDGAVATDRAPDLVTDVTTLSAAYLGGRSWHQLAATGAAEQRRDGALDLADALFQVSPAPFCGTFF